MLKEDQSTSGHEIADEAKHDGSGEIFIVWKSRNVVGWAYSPTLLVFWHPA